MLSHIAFLENDLLLFPKQLMLLINEQNIGGFLSV